MKHTNHFVTALIFVLVSSSPIITLASEKLTVIQDNGGVAIDTVLESVTQNTKEEIAKSLEDERKMRESGGMEPNAIRNLLRPSYPITSHLQERSFTPKEFEQTRSEITRPIALIGNGPRSIRWLKQYRSRLKNLGAFVVLVEAESDEQLYEFQKIYGDKVAIMNLDDFTEKYQIPALPALLTENGIYQ
ncbi:TPA: DUF2859 domain-containing protein [Vibrio vulnificus]|nr:DUF2859 domain-containing protein [Vibrio vulnificus]